MASIKRGIAFDCATAKVRTFIQDGIVWIIGADIITELSITSASYAYGRLAEDELVMRSDKPKARVCKEWVTREVLPAIRKTGGGAITPQTRKYAGMPTARDCSDH